MILRFPRLSPVRARSVLANHPADLDTLAAMPVPDLSTCRFAATGGRKVTQQELVDLREDLMKEAVAAGYPAQTLQARQVFDRRLAVRLAGYGFPPGETLRAEVWAWMCVHLVPSLVAWRFGGRDTPSPLNRYAGILQRNALGRLWLRGVVFDRGEDHEDRWGLVKVISEDALLAILDRTALSGDWRLARAVGERWLLSRQQGEKADLLLREASKRILVSIVFIETGCMDEATLARFVDRAFSPG